MISPIYLRRLLFRKLPLSFLNLFLFIGTISAQTYGLHFASRETMPENRTSLELAPAQPLCLDGEFSISFDLHFVPGQERYSGYIFRIINEKAENIDLLFDSRDKLLKVIFKETFTDIQCKMGEDFFSWNNLRLSYHPQKGFSFWINDRHIATQQIHLTDDCLRIFFGANRYQGFRNSDIPPMELRNIRIMNNDQLSYFWTLNNTSGNETTDSVHQAKAKVVNPQWIAPLHSNWQKINSFHVKGNASIAFDSGTEQLYAIGNDSLYTYSASSGKLISVALHNEGNKLPHGNQSVFNLQTKELFNFYPDGKRLSRYNPGLQKWLPALTGNGQLTGFWHVNKFISPVDSSLYIIGGYGYNKYKKLVLRCNLNTNKWDTIQTSGDTFAPRYLAAAGLNKNGDTAFLLGGYGSQSGDQMLSPGYFYTLYAFDIRNHTFTKRYTLKEPAEHFVFSNSLIINEADRTYYALIYPKDQFNTNVQLIRGSLDKPEYELLGNKLPYFFFDSKSYLDLFACKQNNALIAVTLFRIDDTKGGGYEDVSSLPPDELAKMADATAINIYTIADPPNLSTTATPASLPVTKNSNSSGLVFFILAALAAMAIAFLIFKRIRKKEATVPAIVQEKYTVAENPGPGEGTQQAQVPVSRISLFGNFEVFDKTGNNLTQSFTPLLKELFLMIIIYTIRLEKGVSLDTLNENFWSGKDARDLKNNRAVNIAKLKALLEKLDSCTLRKEAGQWKFIYDKEQVYVDFAAYYHIISRKFIADRQSLDELLDITRRGTFLQYENYKWLDDIKSEVSNNLLNQFTRYSSTLPISGNAELLIRMADTIFLLDELNEEALTLKCRSLIALGRHAIAKGVFEKFAVKYRQIYAEEFPVSFQQIINTPQA